MVGVVVVVEKLLLTRQYARTENRKMIYVFTLHLFERRSSDSSGRGGRAGPEPALA